MWWTAFVIAIGRGCRDDGRATFFCQDSTIFPLCRLVSPTVKKQEKSHAKKRIAIASKIFKLGRRLPLQLTWAPRPGNHCPPPKVDDAQISGSEGMILVDVKSLPSGPKWQIRTIKWPLAWPLKGIKTLGEGLRHNLALEVAYHGSCGELFGAFLDFLRVGAGKSNDCRKPSKPFSPHYYPWRPAGYN